MDASDTRNSFRNFVEQARHLTLYGTADENLDFWRSEIARSERVEGRPALQRRCLVAKIYTTLLEHEEDPVRKQQWFDHAYTEYATALKLGPGELAIENDLAEFLLEYSGPDAHVEPLLMSSSTSATTHMLRSVIDEAHKRLVLIGIWKALNNEPGTLEDIRLAYSPIYRDRVSDPEIRALQILTKYGKNVSALITKTIRAEILAFDFYAAGDEYEQIHKLDRLLAGEIPFRLRKFGDSPR